MVEDADTFTFVFNIYNVYWSQGGGMTGAFVDGSKGIMNPESSDNWWCVNVPGACPSKMPWNPAQPKGSERCVGIWAWYIKGVGVLSCSNKYMAMCKFTA